MNSIYWFSLLLFLRSHFVECGNETIEEREELRQKFVDKLKMYRLYLQNIPYDDLQYDERLMRSHGIMSQKLLDYQSIKDDDQSQWKELVDELAKEGYGLLKGKCDRLYKTNEIGTLFDNFFFQMIDKRSRNLLLDIRYDKVILLYYYDKSYEVSPFVIIFHRKPIEDFTVRYMHHIRNPAGDLMASTTYRGLNSVANWIAIPSTTPVVAKEEKLSPNLGVVEFDTQSCSASEIGYRITKTLDALIEENGSNEKALLDPKVQRIGIYVKGFMEDVSVTDTVNFTVVVEFLDIHGAVKENIWNELFVHDQKHRKCTPKIDDKLNDLAQCVLENHYDDKNKTNDPSLLKCGFIHTMHQGIFIERYFNPEAEYKKPNYPQEYLSDLARDIKSKSIISAEGDVLNNTKNTRCGIGLVFFTTEAGTDYWKVYLVFAGPDM